MKLEQMHPADQLVMIMERIYAGGMTTTSGGNLSILDDNGDMWITPSGVDKGSLTRKDIMCVRADGTIEGIHKPSVEFPFHLLAYKKRPDFRAVLHAHPPALVAFSIVRRLPDISVIPNARLICRKIEMAPYDLPGSTALGEKIAAVFEKGSDAVVLENHGVVVGSSSIQKAFMIFETLDFCGRMEIGASCLGKTKSLSESDVGLSEDQQNMPEFTPQTENENEKNIREHMCRLIHRAYDMKLIMSSFGAFSQRVSGNDFIITPHGIDRKSIREDDFVLIREGSAEAGKHPSHSVGLHRTIYENHPEIDSIIVAQPPSAMAFAVTSTEFDSRIIPESYIVLRNIPMLPYGARFNGVGKVSDALSLKTPLAMISNDCFVVTGKDMLNAYDRLEVLEYSARAIIKSKSIGDIVTIKGRHIDDIEEAFKLEK